MLLANPAIPTLQTRKTDLAIYGIVKVLRKANPLLDIMEQWEPKEAFHKLADLYGDI